MKNKLFAVSETLKELLIGILAFEILCQFSIMWFVKNIGQFSIGLWIGALLAAISAVHMNTSLTHNFEKNGDDEKAVQAYATRSNLIRYLIIVLAFFVICVTDFAYPLATFLGIMGLKVGAYLQPLTHMIFERIKNTR